MSIDLVRSRNDFSLHNDAWASPAFLKRSFEISSSYDAFLDDDTDFPDNERRKKRRFGKGIRQWRFAERSPSPEKVAAEPVGLPSPISSIISKEEVEEDSGDLQDNGRSPRLNHSRDPESRHMPPSFSAEVLSIPKDGAGLEIPHLDNVQSAKSALNTGDISADYSSVDELHEDGRPEGPGATSEVINQPRSSSEILEVGQVVEAPERKDSGNSLQSHLAAAEQSGFPQTSPDFGLDGSVLSRSTIEQEGLESERAQDAETKAQDVSLLSSRESGQGEEQELQLETTVDQYQESEHEEDESAVDHDDNDGGESLRMLDGSIPRENFPDNLPDEVAMDPASDPSLFNEVFSAPPARQNDAPMSDDTAIPLVPPTSSEILQQSDPLHQVSDNRLGEEGFEPEKPSVRTSSILNDGEATNLSEVRSVEIIEIESEEQEEEEEREEEEEEEEEDQDEEDEEENEETKTVDIEQETFGTYANDEPPQLLSGASHSSLSPSQRSQLPPDNRIPPEDLLLNDESVKDVDAEVQTLHDALSSPRDSITKAPLQSDSSPKALVDGLQPNLEQTLHGDTAPTLSRSPSSKPSNSTHDSQDENHVGFVPFTEEQSPKSLGSQSTQSSQQSETSDKATLPPQLTQDTSAGIAAPASPKSIDGDNNSPREDTALETASIESLGGEDATSLRAGLIEKASYKDSTLLHAEEEIQADVPRSEIYRKANVLLSDEELESGANESSDDKARNPLQADNVIESAATQIPIIATPRPEQNDLDAANLLESEERAGRETTQDEVKKQSPRRETSLIRRLKEKRRISGLSAKSRVSSFGPASPWFAPRKPSGESSKEAQSATSAQTSPENLATGLRPVNASKSRLFRSSIQSSPTPTSQWSDPSSPQYQPSSQPAAGFRTTHSYFVPLTSLHSHYGIEVDVLAVVLASKPIVKAASGPRDYVQSIHLVDPSVQIKGTSSRLTMAQILRPRKTSLPRTVVGDAILLRNFKVHSFHQSLALQSTESSAWAIFRKDTDVQVRGPPIEYGPEERAFARAHHNWWDSLGEKEKEKLFSAAREMTFDADKRATKRGSPQQGLGFELPPMHESATSTKRAGRHARPARGHSEEPTDAIEESFDERSTAFDGSAKTEEQLLEVKEEESPRRILRPRNARGTASLSPEKEFKSPSVKHETVHELRDGTKYVDVDPEDVQSGGPQSKGASSVQSLHRLRDGTTYQDRD